VPYWCSLDFGHLGNVVLVVDTVAQDVAKVPQGAFQRICRPFFLGLLKTCRLALAVLDVAVSNILADQSAQDPN
jgi:hypothetical protein